MRMSFAGAFRLRSVRTGFAREVPGRIGHRHCLRYEAPGLIAGGRAIQHAFGDSLHDAREPEEIEGEVPAELRNGLPAHGPAVTLDEFLARGNAERLEVETGKSAASIG